MSTYHKLYEEGKLKFIEEKLSSSLSECKLCPRECKVNRIKGEVGFCKTKKYAIVASVGPHFGEEAPLVGENGSGTIFISGCNLGCIFCQNYDISHKMEGREVKDEELGKMMINLQEIGCHNINIVTPTHVVPQIIRALKYAIEWGLRIPLVYNTGGYEKVDTLRLIEGVFDIYMPDFKFYNKEIAKKLANAEDYPERVKESIEEMYRQVGDLQVEKGIAKRGLIIRHLILPKNLANTKEVLKFVGEKISKNTYLNIMDQYRPCGESWKVEELGRGISYNEYFEAIKVAQEVGLCRLDSYG
jgi:putative pyruvate formate lyase activating enzyme